MPLSWNLGTLTSWNPLGHSRPVTGLLLLLCPIHKFVILCSGEHRLQIQYKVLIQILFYFQSRMCFLLCPVKVKAAGMIRLGHILKMDDAAISKWLFFAESWGHRWVANKTMMAGLRDDYPVNAGVMKCRWGVKDWEKWRNTTEEAKAHPRLLSCCWWWYFLLLRSCILIVMYALFCIFCFHRAIWHAMWDPKCSQNVIEVQYKL